MRRADSLRRAAWVVAAVLAGVTACDFDSSVLGCSGLAGDELAKCEYYNRCLGQSGDDLTRCLAAGAAGAGGESGSTQGGGGAPMMGAAGLGGGGSGGNGGLVCTTPTTDCGGTCINVKADDAANCGACGRSCLGTATCAAGACVPEPMAANEVAPYALAQDATSLYWVSPAIKGVVDSAKMRRVLKTSVGGPATNAFDSTRVRARSLGFDGTKLYWGDLGASPSDTNQRVLSAAPADLGPQLVEAAQLNVQHVAVAGGKVYWTVANDAAVRGKLSNGTGVVSPNVGLQSSVGWLAVDDDAKPYWLAGVPREVRRLAATPANTGEKVADSANAIAVELAGERFYWADGTTVRSRPKAAPTETPRDEFSGQGAVEGFVLATTGAGGASGAAGASGASGAGGAGGAGAVGEVTLYVLTAQGRQLKTWRKGPDDDAPLLLGEVTVKAATYTGNPFGAAHVMVDGSYVYFADVGTVDTNQVVPVSQGDGVVYRVAR
jgi:hypothetical protein